MSFAEIQDAVAKLSDEEKRALLTWLASENEPEISAEEEQKLLRSLDEAARDIDAGKGVSIDDIRQRVGSWAAK
jgi:hypothetical protein